LTILNIIGFPGIFDNGISWPGAYYRCNHRCEGCYRDLNGRDIKTSKKYGLILKYSRRLRKSDCMSIAGGDPSIYPNIV
jgi:organic radical activating enzyme